MLRPVVLRVFAIRHQSSRVAVAAQLDLEPALPEALDAIPSPPRTPRQQPQVLKFPTPAVTKKVDLVSWEDAKPYSSVPGPKPLPLLGNSWRFLPIIGNYKIEEVDKVSARLFEEYGPVVRLGGLLGRPDMLFLFDADEIEKVFRNEETMPHRPSMPSLNHYKHKLHADIFGKDGGVIAVHGEDWYRFRSRVQQPMLQPRTARLYVSPVEETALEFVNRIREIRDSNKDVPADFMNEIHKWSLESIAKVALDQKLGCLSPKLRPESDAQRMIHAVGTFFSNVGVLELKIPFWRLFPTPTWRKYISALDTIHRIAGQYVESALEELQSNPRPLDHSSSLLQRVLAQDAGAHIAKNLALDLFLVGIDTTSSAVASILYQLALNPEIQERLYAELPPREELLTPEALDKLSYLRACIRETLRMFPVVIGNGRCMMKDTVIAGYQIPAGVQVVFQHLVISNQERYFPDPQRFLPDRWLKQGKEACTGNTCPVRRPPGPHPFASLPFGYGRRMCLGRRFADLELQVLITKILQNFRVEYHHTPLEYRITPMYMPKGPLKLRFVERE